MSSSEKRYRGLTTRVILIFLFSAFVIQPLVLYYYLLTNSFHVLSYWIPILLFAEIANLMRARLTDKELFLLLTFQPVAFAYSLLFISLIRNMYFAYSEPSKYFGIVNYIPSWWVPSESTVQKLMYSKFIFLNQEWIMPILISLTFMLLNIISDLILGYLSYEVFVVEEKLEFPFMRSQIAMINSLSERDPNFVRVLFVSALGGMIMNLAFKFIPFVLGSLLLGGTLVYGTPSYGMDFTSYLDNFLPGAAFYLSTDPISFIPGLLLPVKVTIIQFIASFLLYFIGTYFITKFDLWPSESKWATGWGYGTLHYRALIYFYVSLIIGLALAAMIVPLILNPTPIVRGIKSLSRSVSKGQSKLISSKTILLLYLLSSFSMVFLAWYLTNFSFPILILILLIIGGSFFAVYISTASAGVTVFGTNVPYLRELSIYFSGHTGKDIWFVPLPATLSSSVVGTAGATISSPLGGSAVAQSLLGADLVGVKHSEFIKAYGILIVLSLISSFILASIFWYISPIPSSAYPYTVTGWPVDALSWARMQVWIWTGYLFRPVWILLGIISGSLIYVVSTFAFKMPSLLIIGITGALMGIPSAFSQLIGSIFGEKVLARSFKEKWRSYSRLIVSGYLLGDAIVETIRILIVVLVRAQWLLPF